MARKPAPAELAIVYRDIRKLIPYSRNARQHSPEQAQMIAGLMREFGWTNPILLDGKRGVVAGHGRIDGARLVWETGGAIVNTPAPWMAPCIDIGHWTESQKRAYILADNASAEMATWSDDLRALELAELRAAGFDLSLTGFPEDDIAALLAALDGGELPAPDDARAGAGSLAERFGVPPFSVLNAREGWWQDRKRAWLALGIKSELGRGEMAIDPSQSASARMNDAAEGQRRYRRATAAPGGSPRPLDRKRAGKANATPGGAKMPAADYSKRQRGDGRGRPADARSFRQDIMRGEHVVAKK